MECSAMTQVNSTSGGDVITHLLLVAAGGGGSSVERDQSPGKSDGGTATVGPGTSSPATNDLTPGYTAHFPYVLSAHADVSLCSCFFPLFLVY